MCGRCAKAAYESNRRWLAKNPDKAKGYNLRRNRKRSANRSRCLGCPAPVKRFRRCAECRARQVRLNKRRQRARPSNMSEAVRRSWEFRRRKVSPYEALALRELGLTYAAIAHHLGCSMPTAFSLVKRAKQR